jgi:hypothetical protein
LPKSIPEVSVFVVWWLAAPLTEVHQMGRDRLIYDCYNRSQHKTNDKERLAGLGGLSCIALRACLAVLLLQRCATSAESPTEPPPQVWQSQVPAESRSSSSANSVEEKQGEGTRLAPGNWVHKKILDAG